MSLKCNKTSVDVTGRILTVKDKVCMIIGWKRNDYDIIKNKIPIKEIVAITIQNDKDKYHFKDGTSTVKPVIKVEDGNRPKI